MPNVQTISDSKIDLAELNGAQLQARLETREESLKRHLEGLADEVRGFLEDGEEVFSERPSRIVAAVAVAAVAAGLYLGWKGRSAHADDKEGPADLLDGYSRSFAEEVSRWLDKGKTVGEAVARAFQGARPVIYFEPPPERSQPETSRSKVKKTVGSLAKAAFGYAVRAALAEVSGSVVRRRR